MRDWRRAMEMYNQAVRFAANSSNYMGYLYAKRGLCFGSMKMYAAGIADMSLSIAHNSSPDWSAECDKFIKNYTKQTESFKPLVPTLSFEHHADYAAMTNVLELKFDGENRPYIVAIVDIDVGKTILIEETFVAVTNSFNKTCCATCLSEMRNFFPCSECIDAVFCSFNCYRQNQIHKDTCGQNFHRMPTPVRFVIHSILQAISIFPTADFLMHFVQVYTDSPNAMSAAAKIRMPLDVNMQNYGLFLNQKIQNAVPNATVSQVYNTLLTMEAIPKYFNAPEKLNFLMDLVEHHTMVLNCNAYGGFESDQNQFISGTMANLVAMIKHSCTPNVAHFAYGSKEVCVIVIIRPIRAGEKLCYDYWPDEDGGDVMVWSECTCTYARLYFGFKVIFMGGEYI